MDEVRIRAGNIIRPVGSYEYNGDTFYTYDDEQIVLDSEDNIVSESDLPLGEIGTQLKEFFVQVGTQIDDATGVDDSISPYVGMIGMGEKLIDEQGAEIASGNKSLNFLVKTAAGGGIAIADDGSFLILDQLGGSVTKFSAGADGEKSLRVGNNYVSINAENGILLSQDTGSTITIDKAGIITLAYKNGTSLLVSDVGLSLNFPETTINLIADAVKIVSTTGTVLGVGNTPPDTLLCGTRTATWFDTIFFPALATWLDGHVHVGPLAPAAPYFTSSFAAIVAAAGLTLPVTTGLVQAPKVTTD
jgi:hypothetical protein